MILVGNQRGGAKNLGLHLLKEENDHVEVYELRGFASDNLHSALNETYAISRGTQCKQFLYSLSINPPPDADVSTDDFEDAINRAELKLGLTGQPRAIVFHEKAGTDGLPRRHAHAVWSRIIADEMKAVQMSHDHRKLTELSRELYLDHGWKMPRGLMVSEERDPRQFTMEEWQQAKRAKVDAREIKAALKDCWAVSDSRAAFMAALESRGFKLARGDRRGFVAVDMSGEPYAVAKWVEIRTKEVRARLGELNEDFPSVEQRKHEFAQQISQRLSELHREEERKEAEERQRQEAERRALVERQRIERAEQATALKARQDSEIAERQDRFKRGLRGLLDRITGRHGRIREQNIAETEAAMQRDRAEKDAVVFRQLGERRTLDEQRRAALEQMQERQRELQADIQQHQPPPAEQARVVTPRPRLTHCPHCGTYHPPGSLLDGNPGSTLSGNQHRPEVKEQEPARAPPQPMPAPAVAPPQPEPVPAITPPPEPSVQANNEQVARDARRDAFIEHRQEQATQQPTHDRGPSISR
ncbi:hypothetical protein SAMN05518801_1375 [Novosphingobium sp. CF614]|uniref:relaxase/mobilization nuclease domain-containing protein n=1 Tax=Novosphingobium sp. CF614 TaxID=1884364 RepID=UPI0008E866F0|nr:hypothetical protein [Novosphingobium sp. CF614]SFG50686.1 hypothetical protein SAMN05518801_1375 [Novosphingobium sp. CF614]